MALILLILYNFYFISGFYIKQNLQKYSSLNCMFNEKIKESFEYSPYLESPEYIDSKMSYESELFKCLGVENYITIGENHRAMKKSLSKYSYKLIRFSKLNDDKFISYWNVSYLPETTVSLVQIFSSFSNIPIIYFDLLDKEGYVSTFSWRALFKTLIKVIQTGNLCLPHAVILGSSEYHFKKLQNDQIVSYQLYYQKDKLNLINSLDKGTLRNRKLTYDLLEYIDASKPSFYDLDEWNNLITKRIDVRNIPGMGQFDIDGLGELSPDRNFNSIIVPSATLLVITFVLSSFISRVLFYDLGDLNNIPLF